MRFSAVILAGGRSTRMGCNKAWLNYRGRPLIVHQIQRIRMCRPEEIFISSDAAADYTQLGLAVLADNFPCIGPMGGIERALENAMAPFLLVLAVDMPLLSASMLRRLLAHCEPGRGVLPRTEGRVQPLAAIYPKAAHPLLLQFIAEGIRNATRFATACAGTNLSRYLEIPVSRVGEFANWNTPADVLAHTDSSPSAGSIPARCGHGDIKDHVPESGSG